MADLENEGEEKYRVLVENANEAIFVLQDGLIRFHNRMTERLLGFPSEELPEVAFFDRIHPKDTPRALECFGHRLDGQDPPTSRSFRVIQKTGGEQWVEANAVHISWLGRPAILCFLRDLTHQKRLEDHLRRAQKMEAIGALAGGIAHDFNNILSAIMGYTELAHMDLPGGSKTRNHLDEVLKASERAKELVKQILTLSRQTEQERRPLDISPIIKEAVKMLRASLPSTIEIRQHIDPEKIIVDADPTQVHQVLMSLCTNAAYAMRENGGVLEVSLRKADLALGDPGSLVALPPGTYVRLTVKDTGTGMTPETLERIFDPYFTTKEKGHGTGLGLAVTHSILRSHAGAIHVESELGKGSSLHAYLPAVKTHASKERGPKRDLPKGRGRILFVDDEKALVHMGKQVLELLGYHVDAFSDSLEALETFKMNPGQWDLVVSDMTMPHLTGEVLAGEILSLRPELPIVLCTGFSEHITEQKAREIGIKAFVTKPVLISEIARIVGDILASPPGLGERAEPAPYLIRG